MARTHKTLLNFQSLIKVVFLLFLSVLTSCDEQSLVRVTGDDNPVLSELKVPEFVYNASVKSHTISVRVVDPQGIANIASASVQIVRVADNMMVLQENMVDDATQGDIIPNDGMFAFRFDGSIAQGQTGEFAVEVSAVDRDGNESEPLAAQFTVLAGVENLAPEITAVQAPVQVAADSSYDFLITAQVTDPEGPADVANVSYQFFPPAFPTPAFEDSLYDDGTSGDVTAGDGIYSATLNSDLIRDVSDYFIRFQAEDASGNQSVPRVAVIRGFLTANQPPVISNLSVADTVQIDPQRTVQILITIDASDPEGLSDIEFVRFRSFLPNGEEANNSPTELSDDGDINATGDEVAGDGTYSVIINLPPNTPAGNYRFVFQAKDRSDAFSNEIEHIITIEQ